MFSETMEVHVSYLDYQMHAIDSNAVESSSLQSAVCMQGQGYDMQGQQSASCQEDACALARGPMNEIALFLCRVYRLGIQVKAALIAVGDGLQLPSIHQIVTAIRMHPIHKQACLSCLRVAHANVHSSHAHSGDCVYCQVSRMVRLLVHQCASSGQPPCRALSL